MTMQKQPSTRVTHGRRSPRVVGVVSLALGLLVAGPAFSAQLQLVLSDQVSYGDPIVAELRVINPNQASGQQLTMPQVRGLTIQGPSQRGREISTVNGRTTHTIKYVYQITPAPGVKGTYTVGPVSLTQQGQPPLRSNTVKLTVAEKPDLGLRFTCEAPRTDGDIAESFRVVYTLAFPRDAVSQSSLDQLTLSIPLLEAPGVEVKPVAATPGKQTYPFRLSREQTIRFQQSFVVNADRSASTAFVFGFEVTPMRAGTIALGGAKASMPMLTGEFEVRTERGIFGDRRRVRVPKMRRFEAKTDAVTYRVRPPPAEGQPEGFTGQIGRYTISVTTKDREFNQFDPIRLEVVVRGKGLFSNLPAPAWSRMASLTQNFGVASDVDSGSVDAKGTTKTFHQTVRPLTPDVKEIPSIPFPYYDPWLKKYAVARSRPIPITVVPNSTIDPEEAYRKPQQGAPQANPSAVAVNPIFEQGGVAANFADPGSPSTFVDPRTRLTGWPFLAALGLPPLAFGMLLLALRAARRSPERRARDRAHARARAALGSAGDDAEALTDAYQTYFRERFELPPGELTPTQLRNTLRAKAIPDAIAARATTQLETLLATRFGGGEAPPASRVLSIIKDIETCRVR